MSSSDVSREEAAEEEAAFAPPPSTMNVLGYCRSTVGGFDVWAPGAAAPLCALRGALATSINRMNFAATEAALEWFADHWAMYAARSAAASEEEEHRPPPLIELRVGCFAVAGLLSGRVPARAPHVIAMCERFAALRSARLPAGAEVRVVYVRGLDPPRELVGHRRPPRAATTGSLIPGAATAGSPTTGAAKAPCAPRGRTHP
jgi:hypothetical protein